MLYPEFSHMVNNENALFRNYRVRKRRPLSLEYLHHSRHTILLAFVQTVPPILEFVRVFYLPTHVVILLHSCITCKLYSLTSEHETNRF